MIDHATLDEATKRHPLIVKRIQFAIEARCRRLILMPDEHSKIRNEYRRLVQERTKKRTK